MLPKAEGAYTNVELRAFQESALGAGSAKAYMLVDHAPLTVVNHAEMKKHFTKPAF